MSPIKVDIWRRLVVAIDQRQTWRAPSDARALIAEAGNRFHNSFVSRQWDAFNPAVGFNASSEIHSAQQATPLPNADRKQIGFKKHISTLTSILSLWEGEADPPRRD